MTTAAARKYRAEELKKSPVPSTKADEDKAIKSISRSLAFMDFPGNFAFYNILFNHVFASIKDTGTIRDNDGKNDPWNNLYNVQLTDAEIEDLELPLRETALYDKRSWFKKLSLLVSGTAMMSPLFAKSAHGYYRTEASRLAKEHNLNQAEQLCLEDSLLLGTWIFPSIPVSALINYGLMEAVSKKAYQRLITECRTIIQEGQKLGQELGKNIGSEMLEWSNSTGRIVRAGAFVPPNLRSDTFLVSIYEGNKNLYRGLAKYFDRSPASGLLVPGLYPVEETSDTHPTTKISAYVTRGKLGRLEYKSLLVYPGCDIQIQRK